MLEMRDWRSTAACAMAACLLAACASKVRAPAPVEDRSSGARTTAPAPAVAADPRLPGAENANRPGYYTVRPGDTLIRIALDAGQNWRDIARWNGLENPNLIEVGQVLRVTAPPAAAPATAAATATPPAPPRHATAPA